MRDEKSWIQTFTGKMFWPLDPRPEDVDIRDIAHQLSLENRFSGATREPYTVAQHSVMCAWLVETWGGGKTDCLAALLHDSTEAYLKDVSAPVKYNILMQGYKTIESNLESCIFTRFQLDLSMSPLVKKADRTMLVTEKRDLMCHDLHWPLAYRTEEPASFIIKPWGWREAEQMFLAEFASHGGQL